MTVAKLPNSQNRVHSIDIVRGIMMILMSFGHAKHFIISYDYDPSDLAKTSVVEFFGRVISNLSAPGFVIIAGMSIYIVLQKSGSHRERTIFLIKRGLWLILLEIFLFTPIWNNNYHEIQLQVIWAIGVGFLLMALFIHFPLVVNLVVAVSILVLHNLLDLIDIDQLHGTLKILMLFLDSPGEFPLTDSVSVLTLYSILPYFGIMLLGFCAGWVIHLSPDRRRKLLLTVALGMIVLFLLLRLNNGYGALVKWEVQERGFLYTVMSFLNLNKYPPSLHYSLLMLGVTVLLLALFENSRGSSLTNIKIFGQVAMFFYIIHVPFIRLLAKLFRVLFDSDPSYFVFLLLWLFQLVVLMMVCRVYGRFKMARKSDPHYWWLRYL